MNNIKNILVIEDNPGDYILIEEFILEKFQSSRVFHCENYEQTIAILEQGLELSTILLDIHLPDYHGNKLVQDIKNLVSNVPIIVLTGYSDINLAHKCLTVGATDFLLKDEITPEILYKSISYASERMSFIESIEQEKENYQRLFSLSPQPMLIFDKDNLQILNVNKSAIEKYGYSLKEFLSKTILDIRPESDVSQFHITRKEYENLSEIQYQENFRHITKSGKIIDVEVHRKDVIYNGKNARMVLINDITEKQKYLKTIEKQNIKLKKIAWNQSHIVRAPLSRILGIINLLEIGNLDNEETIFFLNQIKNSANELDNIVKEIVNETKTIT